MSFERFRRCLSLVLSSQIMPQISFIPKVTFTRSPAAHITTLHSEVKVAHTHHTLSVYLKGLFVLSDHLWHRAHLAVYFALLVCVLCVCVSVCALKASSAGWPTSRERFCSYWSVSRNCNVVFPKTRSVLADRNMVLCYSTFSPPPCLFFLTPSLERVTELSKAKI